MSWGTSIWSVVPLCWGNDTMSRSSLLRWTISGSLDWWSLRRCHCQFYRYMGVLQQYEPSCSAKATDIAMHRDTKPDRVACGALCLGIYASMTTRKPTCCNVPTHVLPTKKITVITINIQIGLVESSCTSPTQLPMWCLRCSAPLLVEKKQSKDQNREFQ